MIPTISQPIFILKKKNQKKKISYIYSIFQTLFTSRFSHRKIASPSPTSTSISSSNRASNRHGFRDIPKKKKNSRLPVSILTISIPIQTTDSDTFAPICISAMIQFQRWRARRRRRGIGWGRARGSASWRSGGRRRRGGRGWGTGARSRRSNRLRLHHALRWMKQ